MRGQMFGQPAMQPGMGNPMQPGMGNPMQLGTTDNLGGQQTLPGTGSGQANKLNKSNKLTKSKNANNNANNANNANNNANNANNNANNANNDNSVDFLEKNIDSYKNIIIILVCVLILIIIGYFMSYSYRESHGLSEIYKASNYFFIESQVHTRENRTKKLGDFFINGAFRPYMVINQRLDYCSLEMLKAVLIMGVRAVYIDVFNNTLNENAYPIVTTGIKNGEWKLGLNSLLFEDVCNMIASVAFSNGYVNNFNDPFVLCLNLNTNGNVKCLKKIKKILYRSFRSNLLSSDYTFSSNNMAEVKISELIGKVVILTSDGYQNSELEELVNYSWDKDELNKISYKSLDPNVPEEESIKFQNDSLKDFNKNNMTIVVPDESAFFTSNFDPQYGHNGGCQLVFMNYNKMGPELDSYITTFKHDSFLPKPDNMISLAGSEGATLKRVIHQQETGEDNGGQLKCPSDAAG
jgi:hypothetical protein